MFWESFSHSKKFPGKFNHLANTFLCFGMHTFWSTEPCRKACKINWVHAEHEDRIFMNQSTLFPKAVFTLYLRLTFYYNKHRETHLFVKHPCISDSPKSIRKPIQRKITGKSIRNHDPVGNSGDPLQQGLRNRGNPWSGGKLLSSGKKLRVLKYEIF